MTTNAQATVKRCFYHNLPARPCGCCSRGCNLGCHCRQAVTQAPGDEREK